MEEDSEVEIIFKECLGIAITQSYLQVRDWEVTLTTNGTLLWNSLLAILIQQERTKKLAGVSRSYNTVFSFSITLYAE